MADRPRSCAAEQRRWDGQHASVQWPGKLFDGGCRLGHLLNTLRLCEFSNTACVSPLGRQYYPSVIRAHMRPPTTAQLASGSVTSRRAFVHFAAQGERDAALEASDVCCSQHGRGVRGRVGSRHESFDQRGCAYKSCHYHCIALQMNGNFVGGQALRVELPWAEQRPLHPAGQPAAAPAGPEERPALSAGLQYKLFVVNVGDALSADGLCAYFRCGCCLCAGFGDGV